MTTDLAVPDQLVDVRSGELLPATPENAADLIVAARDLRQRILNLVKDCEAVLVEEARRQGTKTLELPAGKAVLSGGPESELVWDVEILDQLTELGLPEPRFDELVRTEITYKVDARVAKQLEAANPEYAGVIAAARSRADKPWRVTVK